MAFPSDSPMCDCSIEFFRSVTGLLRMFYSIASSATRARHGNRADAISASSIGDIAEGVRRDCYAHI